MNTGENQPQEGKFRPEREKILFSSKCGEISLLGETPIDLSPFPGAHSTPFPKSPMVTIRALPTHSPVTVLALAGSMDALSLDSVRSEFEALTSEHRRPTIIEISEVTAIDQGGLQFLLQCARRMHQLRSKLLLAAPSPAVEGSLRQANFHTLIPMVVDLDTGVAQLAEAN